MPHITSANVACGFHAGEPAVMRATVALATAHDVAIGAHPGFPDLEGFGRRELDVTPRDVEGFCHFRSARWRRSRPHKVCGCSTLSRTGLCSTWRRDAALADAVARGTPSSTAVSSCLACPAQNSLGQAGAPACVRVKVLPIGPIDRMERWFHVRTRER